MTAQTSAIIMASGFSDRMKTNKLFLKYRGVTFLERTIQVALSADFDEIIVVIKPEDKMYFYIDSAVKVISNAQSALGQSRSVCLGTTAAKAENNLVFLAIDQPLLTATLLKEIVAAGDEEKVVIPLSDGNLASPVFFGNRYRQELLEVKGKDGGRQVRDNHRNQWILLPIESDKLCDIDTPEDYQKLLQKKDDFESVI